MLTLGEGTGDDTDGFEVELTVLEVEETVGVDTCDVGVSMTMTTSEVGSPSAPVTNVVYVVLVIVTDPVPCVYIVVVAHLGHSLGRLRELTR